MNLQEIERKLLSVAKGDAILESEIKKITASNESEIESKLIALASANPILALTVQAVIPSVKTYLSDLLKSRGPVKIETESEIKIIFED
jgi:hypothetical protein